MIRTKQNKPRQVTEKEISEPKFPPDGIVGIGTVSMQNKRRTKGEMIQNEKK